MATSTAIVSSTFSGLITIWNNIGGSVVELMLGIGIFAFSVFFMLQFIGKAPLYAAGLKRYK